MGLGTRSHEKGDEVPEIVAEINITPLTDIFLVLLIIFMVTSSVMSQMGVDVKLPKSSTASSPSNQPEGVVVTLMPSGALKLNGQTIPGENLPERLIALQGALKNAFDRTSQRLVVLEGDRQAFLGNAISVMDAARKAGAQSFAIATQPE